MMLSNDDIKAVRTEIYRAVLVDKGHELVQKILLFEKECAGNGINVATECSAARDQIFFALTKAHDAYAGGMKMEAA